MTTDPRALRCCLFRSGRSTVILDCMADRAGASCALLAEQLFVDVEDVRWIVGEHLRLDPDRDVPHAWLRHVWHVLNPCGERTVPQLHLQPGDEGPVEGWRKRPSYDEVEWPEL